MDLETLRDGDFAKLGEALTAWKGVYDTIGAAANDGNKKAEGVAGDQ
ncbi:MULTISPECIES: hypothetical protein [Streptomyces]|nr:MULTISPECIES: hypothetical protein [Streptomyces]MEE1778865.1 hypothetical protein [Streptomyces sp. JV181]